ncbi:MAG: hypothetical protein GX442_15070 [Candidatus Riflebacteria bacterium]|nr:hypothetical protein [Candidatus Riflebacteria bacterium]
MSSSCPRPLGPREAFERFFPEAFTVPPREDLAAAFATANPAGDPGRVEALLRALEQDSPDHAAFKVGFMRLFVLTRVQVFHHPGLLHSLATLARERFPDNPWIPFRAPAVTAVFDRAVQEEPLPGLLTALAAALRPADKQFQAECQSIGSFFSGQLGFVLSQARALRPREGKE